MKYTIALPADEFRQALASALLYTGSSTEDSFAYICLHYQENADTATINALDGYGFYQHTLAVDKAATDSVFSLPTGCYAFSDIGQLLISQTTAKLLVKDIRKNATGAVILKAEYKPSLMPGASDYYEVHCSTDFGVSRAVPGIIRDFPDYRKFVEKALANKDEGSIEQGRSFPAREYGRIGKALPPDFFFRTYWGKRKDSPCLLEAGKNIRIVYMPGKWINE